jgi:polyphosphate kinase
MKRISLDDPRYYFNRHLQWLEFNRRVLEEARDKNNPLLERVKFLSITASNLDEFVEVRVSSFLQRIEHGSRETGADGLTAEKSSKKFPQRCTCLSVISTNAGTKSCFRRWPSNRSVSYPCTNWMPRE